MKGQNRKKLQKEFAKQHIDKLFNFLETRFKPEFDSKYVRDIKRFSEGFNIRLKREEKLKFCKNCSIFWNVESREIRFNSQTKTKEYICKNCGFVRRFKY